MLKCSFFNVSFLNVSVTKNEIWHKWTNETGWLRQSWSLMWYLMDIQFYNFFFISLWVKPATFHVSNHFEKGFLCYSWELFYLFTFAAIYSQLQAKKKKMHGMNLKFIEKRSPKTLVKPITEEGRRQCLTFSSWK